MTTRKHSKLIIPEISITDTLPRSFLAQWLVGCYCLVLNKITPSTDGTFAQKNSKKNTVVAHRHFTVGVLGNHGDLLDRSKDLLQYRD